MRRPAASQDGPEAKRPKVTFAETNAKSKGKVKGRAKATPAPPSKAVPPVALVVDPVSVMKVPKAKTPQPAATPTAEPPPAKSSSVVSANAMTAVTTAEADMAAGEVSAAERRKLWMQYLRTRQKDSCGGREKKSAQVRSEKVPDSLVEAVEANPNKYFDIWISSNRSWANVVYKEVRQQQDQDTAAVEELWLFRHEVVARHGPAANALMNALKGTEFQRMYPGCQDSTNPELEQYRLETKNQVSKKLEDTKTRSRTLTANSSSMSTSQIADFEAQNSASQGDGAKPIQSPEEIALAAEEVAKKKQLLKRKQLFR